MSPDWRDGFLFVGNHLALDFLNTRPVIDGDPVELLPHGAALAAWMKAAGLLGPREAKRLERAWTSEPNSAAAVRAFREKWRQAVLRMESGGAPSSAFIAEVNQLLLTRTYVDQLAQSEAAITRVKRFDPRSPLDILAPVADSIAAILTTADWSRLRQCGGCILHFYDTSKKGTRTWCSMAICGNRAKVAAYARRQREGQAGNS